MADTPRSRSTAIAPVLRIDPEPLLTGMESEIDAFIAEAEAKGAPLPEKQAIQDRIRQIIGNIDPNAPEGANSLVRNQRITLHHRKVSPFFTVGTEA